MKVYDDDNDNDGSGWTRATAWKGSGPRTYSLSGGDRTPLARRDEPQARTPEDEERLAAMVDGLVAATRGERATGRAEMYSRLSLLNLARLCDHRPGVAQGLGVVRLAHTRSDFLALLEDVFQRLILDGSELDETSEARIAKTLQLDSFKTAKIGQHGGFPQLVKVGESSPIPEGAFREATNEGVRLETFAAKFVVSEQAIVNDDKGALRDLAASMRAAIAANRESRLWTLLRSSSGAGPTLGDGGALFNSTAVTTAGGHDNLVSGSAPSVTSLGAMAAKLGAKASLGGALLNLRPAFVVCGPATRVACAQAIHEVAAEMRLELLVSAQISDNAWYLAADPERHPFVVRGVLGAGEPSIESRPSWERMGLEVRLADHFGVGISDWRSVVRNPGV